MDKAPAAIETCKERASAAGLDDVRFAVGDPTETHLDQTFVAVVGRLALMHHSDPR